MKETFYCIGCENMKKIYKNIILYSGAYSGAIIIGYLSVQLVEPFWMSLISAFIGGGCWGFIVAIIENKLKQRKEG